MSFTILKNLTEEEEIRETIEKLKQKYATYHVRVRLIKIVSKVVVNHLKILMGKISGGVASQLHTGQVNN